MLVKLVLRVGSEEAIVEFEQLVRFGTVKPFLVQYFYVVKGGAIGFKDRGELAVDLALA